MAYKARKVIWDIFNMADKVEEDEVSGKGVSCVPTDSRLLIHNFSQELLDKVIHFQVLKMEGSLFLWVGRSASMANLCVAMTTKYEDTPAVSCLLGSKADLSSSTLAQRLAKRTKKQCFVSYNLPMDTTFLSLVEKAVIQEMNKAPEKF